MASLYFQPKSKFFWLKFRREDGSVARISTKCSRLNPTEVRRAKQMELEYTLKERSYGTGSVTAGGWLWVQPFLETAYSARPATLDRYSGIWKNLQAFLKETKIITPGQFTRQHCFDYMAWRAKPDRRKGKFRASHNTALLELKTLRVILSEAVVRGLCSGNPCVKLKIRRQDVRRCPELTDGQLEMIRAAIARVTEERIREFYEITFEMGRWQGCRINATQLNPQTDVMIHGQQGTIRFVSKGKDFVTMLHPRLIPLFEQLKAAGRTHTWTAPAQVKDKRIWASLQWTNLLEHSGLRKKIPGVCYRSFRVTVATRMARNNVQISKAKEFLKHASTTVHWVYQRLTPEDLTDCAKAIE